MNFNHQTFVIQNVDQADKGLVIINGRGGGWRENGGVAK
jgi:hypothetical protein